MEALLPPLHQVFSAEVEVALTLELSLARCARRAQHPGQVFVSRSGCSAQVSRPGPQVSTHREAAEARPRLGTLQQAEHGCLVALNGWAAAPRGGREVEPAAAYCAVQKHVESQVAPGTVTNRVRSRRRRCI